jgi:hypothetical protein
MPCSFCGWSGVIGKRGAERGIVKGLCKPCYYREKKNGQLEKIKVKHKCTVEGCDDFIVSKGLCDKHHKRRLRYGDVNFVNRPADWGDKESHPMYGAWRWMFRKHDADICHEWQDFWNFVREVGDKPSHGHRLKLLRKHSQYNKDNYRWIEMEYVGSKEYRDARSASMREWTSKNRDKTKNADLKKAYGITLEDYNRMLQEQNGLCAICSKPETVKDSRGNLRSLAVDHHHHTGIVRKLLCTRCNQGIGNFLDDPDILELAAKYLRS